MSPLRAIPALRAASTSCAGRLTACPPRNYHYAHTVVSIRSYHVSIVRRMAYKDDQDRESLKPKSTEGTASGTDDGAAASDAAFDPSKTSPEASKEAAGKEEGTGGSGNPLEVSGANQGRSKPLGEEGGGEMKDTTNSQRSKASHAGSPDKRGKP